MKTQHEIWQYLCEHGFGRSCMQFYVSNPNEVAKAFWNGVLCVLEAEGKVTHEDGIKIWEEVNA